MQAGYLEFERANCRNCYKCIRECPVKAIGFSENQARILEDECVLCGRCFVTCPQHARQVRNDVSSAKALLRSGSPVYASLAPSFVANYPGVGLEAMAVALARLGFAGTEETARGAALTAAAYEKILREKSRDILISSCCPSVNQMIQRYYPEAVRYLAPVLSPMQAHAALQKRADGGSKTVFIGPCISKKSEIEQYPGPVDCVLTFEELSGWLAEEGIELTAGPAQTHTPGGKSRLFPLPGGILRTMRPCEDYAFLAVDGLDDCIKAVQDILAGGLPRCFIEMSACRGGCAGGPAMEKPRRASVRAFLSVEASVETAMGDGSFELPDLEDDFMVREFRPLPLRKVKIPDEAIAEVLGKIGKTLPEHELNCGTCGYDTCREKARAVVLGKADLAMCLPFLKEKAESFSDIIITNSPNGILVLNERLEIQQINRAGRHILNLESAGDIIGSHVVQVLDPDIFYEALDGSGFIPDRRAYLAEYNRYVQQTVIFDRNYRILILIMRDVTEEENAREQQNTIRRQTVEVTDKVIEKQMRVVQEIASLLGETTAETKIALTKLKESLHLE